MRVLGPPGTGKTTKLANDLVPHLADKYGSDKIMLTSFTKAAANELSQRITIAESSNIGTLHSICFNALGHPNLTETNLSDWAQVNPSLGLNTDAGKENYAAYQIYRNKMMPRDKWLPEVLSFANAWEGWKEQAGLMDFMDLVEEASKLYMPPGSPFAIVIDEAQDFTQLEIKTLRGWATQCKELWVVGDDDQCSREGALISTIEGQKSIEDLDPETDRLVAYNRRSSCLQNNQKAGYSFQIAKRPYQGPMFQFCAGQEATWCTDNHFWQVKWNPELRKTYWQVVYLMKKGSWYRIGRCQLFRDERSNNRAPSLHLNTRMHLEQADAVWPLALFDEKSEAAVYENLMAATYGIPTALFKAQPHSRHVMGQADISLLFNSVPDLEARAIMTLASHDLSIKYPFWQKSTANPYGASVMKMRAINIAKLSEFGQFFMVPVHKGPALSDIEWNPLSVESEYKDKETVYSLDVEEHHTYVADNLCTCNCIYPFAGSDPRNILYPEIPQDQKIILGQSWRVPKTVHTVANRIIQRVHLREPKEYKPRDAEGSVTQGEGGFNAPDWMIDKALSLNQDSMFLVSCNYMLKEIISELRERGVPFSNPWRKEEKSWNPLDTGGAELIRQFLDKGEDGEYWDTFQFLAWAEFLKIGPDGLIRKQGKVAIKQLKELLENDPGTPGLQTCREYITDILSPGAIEPAMNRDVDWLYHNVTKAKSKTMDYARRVLRKNGESALGTETKIKVGTIHSVKGAEASNVFLFPDISYASMREGDTQEGYDNLCRLFYVGVTRAKENLIIMPESGRSFFSI